MQKIIRIEEQDERFRVLEISSFQFHVLAAEKMLHFIPQLAKSIEARKIVAPKNAVRMKTFIYHIKGGNGEWRNDKAIRIKGDAR